MLNLTKAGISSLSHSLSKNSLFLLSLLRGKFPQAVRIRAIDFRGSYVAVGSIEILLARPADIESR